jgi:DNA-binding NtrC family response regulator
LAPSIQSSTPGHEPEEASGAESDIYEGASSAIEETYDEASATEEGSFPDPSGPDFSKLSSFLGPEEAQPPRATASADHGQELVSVELDKELANLVKPILNFPESGVELTSVVNHFEDRLIRAALTATKGVKNQAAKALGLNRTTFLEKLKKKGFD